MILEFSVNLKYYLFKKKSQDIRSSVSVVVAPLANRRISLLTRKSYFEKFFVELESAESLSGASQRTPVF